MRALALAALVVPFGGGEPPKGGPSPEWSTLTVGPLVMLVGPADSKVGFGGLTSDAPVKVAGGTGTLHLRQGLTRDVEVRVTDADVREVAGLFDMPAWLKPKLTGRIGSVVLTIHGDALTLTATKFHGAAGELVSRIGATADLKTRKYEARIYAFGGIAVASGKLPTGE